MTDIRLGHAHLKVRNLQRSIQFYRRVFGLEVTETVHGYAFMTGTGMHHELALQEVGQEAPGPQPFEVGLYHIAFEVPSRQQFLEGLQRLRNEGLEPALVDHGISWAMYFPDPDGNGLEIYWDTRGEPGGTKHWHGRNRPIRLEGKAQ